MMDDYTAPYESSVLLVRPGCVRCPNAGIQRAVCAERAERGW